MNNSLRAQAEMERSGVLKPTWISENFHAQAGPAFGKRSEISSTCIGDQIKYNQNTIHQRATWGSRGKAMPGAQARRLEVAK
jgi:hypothetical protein